MPKLTRSDFQQCVVEVSVSVILYLVDLSSLELCLVEISISVISYLVDLSSFELCLDEITNYHSIVFYALT